MRRRHVHVIARVEAPARARARGASSGSGTTSGCARRRCCARRDSRDPRRRRASARRRAASRAGYSACCPPTVTRISSGVTNTPRRVSRRVWICSMQQRIVGIDAIARPAPHLGGRHRLQAALAPAGDRAPARVDLAVDERIRIALPVGRLDDVALPDHRAGEARAPGDLAMRCGAGTPRHRGPRRGHLWMDEVAAAAAGAQVPLVDQQLVGERHRVARDAELGRERARGRQRGTSGQMAVEDRAHQHLPDLRLQADLAAERQLEQRVPHRLVVAAGHRGAPGLRGTSRRSARLALCRRPIWHY